MPVMKKSGKIKVIVADDHEIYRDGLLNFLNRVRGIEVLSAAENGHELVTMVRQYSPDIVLTDLRMPGLDGISAIRLIAGLGQPIGQIVISTYDDGQLIGEALEAGAMGYLVKNADKAEIVKAIRVVYRGHFYHCITTSSRIMQTITDSRFNPLIIAQNRLFEPREKDIIQMICMENSSKEIAKTMNLSERSVDGIRRRIMEKMNVHSLAGLTRYAIRNKLFDIRKFQ